MKIEVVKKDITEMTVDAIVNAANKSLLGGGGVDGAIHRAAGPKLKEACRKLNGAETGEAKITEGFDLPARYVIHVVGPVYNDGSRGEAEKLKSCYQNSLRLAEEYELKTIAFPAISTGIYGYPKEEAAEIAVDTIRSFETDSNSVETVYLIAFDDETFTSLDQAKKKRG
ncbi:O-acetyl-ADP-ribose deacetylase [Alkalibacterium pelagium]|uniref:O-acetyl-ADP-ribose deacetylase (Regulator of RNase III), contains Macro domain n=1 Tax=Alkalibacterium pelagium TaxID=426702 RepID=A0A1H7PF90_9LACT|nr:O-acetyl-ADP-ribose deacetylase [Alkalibacterium pelagium]GEN51629.1 macro domain-containing protein [Alkalibacterium pelagium]SEL34441.1 O-acetyl-ADP-ribose deacetylase (regulator of RNase III), contains Macro domain [Alkalibacterium pelagium]